MDVPLITACASATLGNAIIPMPKRSRIIVASGFSRYWYIDSGEPVDLLKAVWFGSYEWPHSLSPRTSGRYVADLRHSFALLRFKSGK